MLLQNCDKVFYFFNIVTSLTPDIIKGWLLAYDYLFNKGDAIIWNVWYDEKIFVLQKIHIRVDTVWIVMHSIILMASIDTRNVS